MEEAVKMALARCVAPKWDDEKEIVTEWWIHDGFAYATDKRIALRVRTEDSDTVNATEKRCETAKRISDLIDRDCAAVAERHAIPTRVITRRLRSASSAAIGSAFEAHYPAPWGGMATETEDPADLALGVFEDARVVMPNAYRSVIAARYGIVVASLFTLLGEATVYTPHTNCLLFVGPKWEALLMCVAIQDGNYAVGDAMTGTLVRPAGLKVPTPTLIEIRTKMGGV